MIKLFWGCSLVFLPCTYVAANWGAVFDLEIPSCLLLDGKLFVILFIVGESICLILTSETEVGFLVVVLVGRPLEAKGSGKIIYFGLSLYFAPV